MPDSRVLRNKPKSSDTAVAAARAMMRRRGYVVIGYPPGCAVPTKGEMLCIFAGGLLTDGFLKVRRKTNRKDWDEQFVAIFGKRKKDPNPKERGASFFRCEYSPEVTHGRT